MTLKSPEHLASRTEFCGTPGQSSKTNETGTNGMLYYPSTAVWHIVESCY